jgi:hypothetical protein
MGGGGGALRFAILLPDQHNMMAYIWAWEKEPTHFTQTVTTSIYVCVCVS